MINFREHLLATTMIASCASLAAFSPAAVAQDDETTEEFLVTGSRIARPDFVANSPVTTVGQEELKLSGATSIENLLNELPQVVPGLNGNSNNPGLNGQATVDLRGLGNLRTLVLVNGRRLAPSDKQGTVDLNTIPAALVDRVEVVTGGTSAVYGSDALAGVVNFILKDDFEGVEVGGTVGQAAKGDATEFTIDLTAGGNFGDGKGNAVAYASYFNRNGLLGSEREFSQVATFSSSRVPNGRMENSALNPFPVGAALEMNDAGTDFDNSQPGYNFSPINALVLPADRTTIGGFVDYDFNDTLKGFVELLFTDSRTNIQLAESPLSATNGVTIEAATALALLDPDDGIGNAAFQINNRANPAAPITLQRRMTEYGPRLQYFDKKSYQTTFGFEGTVFEDWAWDASYSFARSDMYDRLFNDQSKSRLQAAIDGCPPGSPAGCVVIDPFGANSITPAGVAYTDLDNVIDNHSYEQQIIALNMAGDLWELPAGDLSVAFGFEYRSDDLEFTPAPASTGDLIGFNGVQATKGSVTVREVYGEALVPLVADAPFAKYIGLEIGGRLSNYSSVGDIETWKVGGEWAIVEQFRIRAMFNKATRAPSVFELFRAGDQNFPSYQDPCRNVGGAAALNGTNVLPGSAEYNFCANWIGLDPIGDPVGTDAALSIFAASDTQVETFLFGNSALEPEEGETVTVGAVLQTETPFGDISASVDWYNIQIDGFITSPTANQLLARCTATLDLLSAECLATPRIATGQLGGLLAPNENTGTIETEGIDIAVAYNLVPEDIGLPIPGSLDVNALVSHLETWDQEGGGINGGAYAGIHTGFAGAFPEWKSTVRTTYSYNDWQFSWQWERIGEMDDYGYTALYPAYYPAVDAIDYHDFSVRWFATENIDATLVCENCFDKEPQNGTVSGYVAGLNVDASTYDVLGRFYRFSLRARF